ncbi:O-antigen ligase family protein [Fervidibacter sacchari]|uniref:O-antigen ligase-related domain-containing protein n=1 Tax=Candidatus Fervidibacter sacchari TaxID=1448929 RepID=A0ABT2ELU1_9BACT|nr:O-antigen ligase family protein [Candidatus Fervidibacter sacchari]MCS3918914.1 hypothetical protein [Candidatus Fervidibacter sacchari]WKU17345.1 O-antigen ligase family protein [Candidatus Fervidibacter sacchari]
MEGIWIKFIFPAIVGLLLPTWFSLVWVIPSLMIFSHSIGPVFSVGNADIQAFDVVLFAVTVKIASTIMVRQGSVYKHQIYRTVASFLGVLLIATVLGGIRFGAEVFLAEMVALLRLGTQVVVIPLMALSVKGEGEVSHVQRFLDYGGYVIVGTIFLNIWLLRIGGSLGEVQVQEGMVRYFGPLGDQVGFVLLYFIFKALMRQRLWEAVCFVVGVVLTGTRGALAALLVGLSVMLWQGFFVKKRARWFLVMLGVCVALGIALWSDVGGMRSRFVNEKYFESGVSQRLLTASIAFRVFLDNPLIGVGFTGFRYVALHYGAVEAAVEKLGGFAPNYIATAGNQFLQVATDGGVIALGAFIWMILVISRSLRWAMEHATPNQRADFAAGYLWLWSLVLGNQTAAWILPGSLISYLLWLLLGLAIGVRLKPHAQQIGQDLSSARAVK